MGKRCAFRVAKAASVARTSQRFFAGKPPALRVCERSMDYASGADALNNAAQVPQERWHVVR